MKDPKTIEQQVQILIDRGLIVDDNDRSHRASDLSVPCWACFN